MFEQTFQNIDVTPPALKGTLPKSDGISVGFGEGWGGVNYV